MNIEWTIARRLIFSKSGNNRTLRPIMWLSVGSTALSVMVMIVALSVLIGFKQQITEKVTGFLAHIQITNYDGNASYETQPINREQDFLSTIKDFANVQHLQPYTLKAGIITTQENIQGVVLKGIDTAFDWRFFDANMVEGTHFTLNDSASSNAVCISRTLANLLQLHLNDAFDMYFVQEPPRQRKFKIAGIFDTQFGDFDKLYVLCDMRHAQRLNGWNAHQITGYEVYVKDFAALDAAFEDISDHTFYTLQSDTRLMVETVKQRYSQIFDWLHLQDLNMWVILVLMLIVAGFNMISSLLIMVLERTTLIGLLKALGTTNVSLRRIFIYQSLFVAGQGMLWGNLVGIGLCLVQQQFGVIALDPATYYLSQVPICIRWEYLLLLNVGTLAGILLILIVPSLLVSKISPSKTLRFN
ncbi:ABC transporter permease [Bacteroidia bacterium]|nr:ABC transporter permease [Bacteroidia bacterium]